MRVSSLLLVVIVLFGAIPALAQGLKEQSPIPERRLTYENGVDFFGGDLRSIFDTSPELCARSCRIEGSCAGFTYNTSARACFLKREISQRETFVGARSAQIEERAPGVVARSEARAANLSMLPGSAITSAYQLALTLETGYGRYGVNSAARTALQTATRDDAAISWLRAAQAGLQSSDSNTYSTRRYARDLAIYGGINAYLRAEDLNVASNALVVVARAMEKKGQGREGIPVLRLAAATADTESAAFALERFVRLYGFRVLDSRVDSNAETPRVCVTFSEPLRDTGFDYAPYVRLPEGDLAVEATDKDLCIVGAPHGSELSFTLRKGLPSQSEEVLEASIDQTFYIKDREPTVRFLGRTYVLARSAEASVPIVTVNTDEVDLTIYHVDDRNIVSAVRDGLVSAPLQRYKANRIPSQMGSEVWSGTGEVARELNADVTTSLPLSEALPAFKPGVYALTAAIPGARQQTLATQWFIVTDLGVATMSGTDGVHVFVRSLGKATPKAGIRVKLVARNNALLGEAETNADGYAAFDAALARGLGGSAPALVEVQEGEEDYAYLSLTEAGFDLSDRGVDGRASPPPLDLFVATDRGVYRPGESVFATILARDSRADAVQGLPLTAITRRPDGVEHKREVLTDEGAGGRVFSLTLPGAAQRGSWQVSLYADPEEPSLTTASFLVEDFVPERIDFELSLPEAPIRIGDSPLLTIDARYLYGAPGADLLIEGETRLRAVQTLPDWQGYSFGPHDVSRAPIFAGIEGQPRTDSEGKASLNLPLGTPGEALGPFEMQANVRLSDASRRVVERSLKRSVAPNGQLIGIRPLFEGSLPEGGFARFNVIALDGNGARTDLGDVPWQLERIEHRYQWYEVNGRWRYDSIIRREQVANGTVPLGTDTEALLEMPVDWGEYQLTVSSETGDFIVTTLPFSAGWYAVGGSTDTPDRLEVALDQPQYAPGDTARLRYTAETDGQLLVTVASDRLIEMKTLEVTQGSGEVELSVSDAWHPGAYVTATLIRPLDSPGTRAPVRALGLGWVGLEPGAAAIGTSFITPPEAAPRELMEVGLKVDAPAGTEVWATIAATDLGILNLTGHKVPDPQGHYLGQRRLGLEMRDLYGRLIDASLGTPGAIRSGGDEEKGNGLKSPPPTEALVAFFSGPLRVGDDGVVRTAFAMPDFNGTVRVAAIVWSAEGVGAASQDVLVRDPVVVSAAMPRFLAPGDQASLSLDLANVTGPESPMTVAVSATGIALSETRTLALRKGAKERITLALLPQDVGDAKITVTTTLGNGTVLTKNLTLGIRRNDPVISRQSRFNLAAGTGAITLDAEVFAGLAPGTSHAVLAAGPLAQFDVPGLLTALDVYPYGCTEQVTSRALPLLYFSEVAAGLGLTQRKNIQKRIEEAVESVLARQSRNGGFGLWSANGYGDLWLEAYVTDFLSRVRAEGYTVPDQALRSAFNNLQNRVNAHPDFEKGGQGLAYALYVLAREGRAAIGDLRYYADARGGTFSTPLARAQIGAALASYGDQTRADRMFRLASNILGNGSDRGWRSDYGSHFRDRAAVLTLAAEAGSEVIDSAALGQEMGRALSAKPYRSTQDKVWALLAARALIKDSSVTDLTRNGIPVDGPLVENMVDGDLATNPVTITNQSPRETLAVLTVFGQPTEPEPAGGNGYRVDRELFDLEGNLIDPSQIKVGTRMVAVVTVTPERDNQARLMVDDPLPAGFEIESPNLLASGDVGALDWLNLGNVATHTEFGTDRFRAAVDWRNKNPFRLGYMVRAVSPGKFYQPAASVEDMYRPAYRGRSATGTMIITEE